MLSGRRRTFLPDFFRSNDVRTVYLANLTKIAAAWARVAFSLGAKVVSVIPFRMPAAKAHSMAARDSSESEAISANAVYVVSSVSFAA